MKFLGRMSKDDLLHEYASALCVVCPAFDEDYGLTCLEAMALGKPVIACADGGGYVELIEDGVDGFLVEATGPAIAAAIDRLKDPALARAMGARGREKAQGLHLAESDRPRRARLWTARRPSILCASASSASLGVLETSTAARNHAPRTSLPGTGAAGAA